MSSHLTFVLFCYLEERYQLSPHTRGEDHEREWIPGGGGPWDPFLKLPPTEDVSAVLNAVVWSRVQEIWQSPGKPFVILESWLSKGQTLMAWRVRMEVVETSIPDSSLKMCMKRCSTLLIIKRNANQNYNDVSPHTGQNGHHQKIYKQKMLEGAWRKWDPLTLLVRT